MGSGSVGDILNKKKLLDELWTDNNKLVDSSLTPFFCQETEYVLL